MNDDFYEFTESMSMLEDDFYDLQHAHDEMQTQFLDLANEVSGTEIGEWYKKRILAILKGDKWREVEEGENNHE